MRGDRGDRPQQPRKTQKNGHQVRGNLTFGGAKEEEEKIVMR